MMLIRRRWQWRQMGRVYTGSYKTGKLWVITPQGGVSAVATKGESLIAITGLAAAPDGTLYIVDQSDTDPGTNGGSVKRMAADGNGGQPSPPPQMKQASSVPMM